MSENSPYPKITPYGARYVAPKGLNAIARQKALQAIRTYGSLTAVLRETPDYLIVGTKRGGTTSLARWLTQHPQIAPLFPARETRKGMYYFDVNFAKGENWYKSHFPTKFAHARAEKKAGKDLLLGDATPYYLHHPHAPQRAAELAPNAKVIALLRDPVERAFSHWVERSRQDVETLSFEDAIAAEEERIAGEEQKMIDDPDYASYTHQHYSYVDQGKYSRGLKRWMDAYPAEQLLILRSEDLYGDGPATYAKVLNFLGIEPHEPKEFSAWNKKKKPEFDEDLKAKLKDLLIEDVSEVERLLDREMGWLQ